MKKLNSILVIDDDAISCFVASRMLEPYVTGSEIKCLKNGLEATEYFKQVDQQYPDLVLLDINMPLMNGFEFLDWYEQNGFKGTTNIAMYTSTERREEMGKAETYEDVIGYIIKAINYEKIEEVLTAMKMVYNEKLST